VKSFKEGIPTYRDYFTGQARNTGKWFGEKAAHKIQSLFNKKIT